MPIYVGFAKNTTNTTYTNTLEVKPTQYDILDDLDAKSQFIKNTIEIVDFGFSIHNATRPVSTYSHGSDGEGRAEFSHFSMERYSSPVSLQLTRAASTAALVGDLTISVFGATADLLYHQFVLRECFISHISVHGSNSNQKLTESLSIAYSAIEWLIQPQGSDKGKAGPDKFALKSPKVKTV